MTFPDSASIIKHALEGAQVCKAGVLRRKEDMKTRPFAHLIPMPGEQDPDGNFRTDIFQVVLYAAGRDQARAVVDGIDRVLTAGPLFVEGLGLVDSVEFDQTADEDSTTDADSYVMTFQIAAETRRK